jgi:hypothetical protein
LKTDANQGFSFFWPNVVSWQPNKKEKEKKQKKGKKKWESYKYFLKKLAHNRHISGEKKVEICHI